MWLRQLEQVRGGVCTIEDVNNRTFNKSRYAFSSISWFILPLNIVYFVLENGIFVLENNISFAVKLKHEPTKVNKTMVILILLSCLFCLNIGLLLNVLYNVKSRYRFPNSINTNCRSYQDIQMFFMHKLIFRIYFWTTK